MKSSSGGLSWFGDIIGGALNVLQHEQSSVKRFRPNSQEVNKSLQRTRIFIKRVCKQTLRYQIES